MSKNVIPVLAQPLARCVGFLSVSVIFSLRSRPGESYISIKQTTPSAIQVVVILPVSF